MKKLYTFLCAVAVAALTAGAATPQLQRAATLERQAATMVSVKSEASAPVAKLAMKAPAKAEMQIGDITGDYLMCGNWIGEIAPSVIEAKVEKGATENTYTFELTAPFTSNKLNAEVRMETVQFTEGTREIPCLVIPGGGTQLFMSADNKEFMFWAVGIYEGKFTRFSDDFVMAIIDDQLVGLYEYGIGWLTAEGRGNGQVTSEPFKSNATAAMNANNGTSYQPTTEKLYCEYDPTKKQIAILGVGSYATPIVLSYDEENDAYTAQDVVLYKMLNPEDTADETVYNLDFVSYIPESGSQEAGFYRMIAFFAEDEGDFTYLMSPYELVGLCNSQVEAVGGWYFKYQNYEIEMPRLNSAAGVSDIIAGEAVDTDAPVEYYNLQGVRVAEPAAGLYIRRQGKTVSKVVIR